MKPLLLLNLSFCAFVLCALQTRAAASSLADQAEAMTPPAGAKVLSWEKVFKIGSTAKSELSKYFGVSGLVSGGECQIGPTNQVWCAINYHDGDDIRGFYVKGEINATRDLIQSIHAFVISDEKVNFEYIELALPSAEAFVLPRASVLKIGRSVKSEFAKLFGVSGPVSGGRCLLGSNDQVWCAINYHDGDDIRGFYVSGKINSNLDGIQSIHSWIMTDDRIDL